MFKRKASLIWSIPSLLLLFLYVDSGNSGQILTIQSQNFASDGRIPQQNTCKGSNKSPSLNWDSSPAQAKSLTLIVEDPDAPGGTFTHWVAYNLPAEAKSLPEGVPQAKDIAGGGMQGVNDFNHYGYDGPCPPPGKVHHYHFRLFALDTMLQVGDKAGASEVKAALKDHVLASGDLVGTFSR